jgi:hypothetical protein
MRTAHTHGMSIPASGKRVRVTVTLSPRVARLVAEKAKLRPDKSRSAAIDELIWDAELARQVREYYENETDEDREEQAFWDAVQAESARLDARDAKARKTRKK